MIDFIIESNLISFKDGIFTWSSSSNELVGCFIENKIHFQLSSAKAEIEEMRGALEWLEDKVWFYESIRHWCSDLSKMQLTDLTPLQAIESAMLKEKEK